MASTGKYRHNCTSRERVKLAIGHRETDRIPRGELVIDDAVVTQILGCQSVGYIERLEFVRRMELDLYCLSPQYPPGDTLPAARDCVFPDLRDWVMNTNLFIFGLLDGVFDWGIKLMGFERFITLHFSSPLSFKDFITRVEKLNLKLITNLAGAGIDGLIIADDLAYQRALLINPGSIREYVLPPLSLQVKTLEQAGIPAFFHSDGNYGEIMQDIVAAGFSGLHCLDRNSEMDMADLRRLYGKRLCLWGNLDVEDTLRAGEPGYLEGLKDTVMAATAGRGLILGTSSGIFKGMDINGLLAVYRSFE